MVSGTIRSNSADRSNCCLVCLRFTNRMAKKANQAAMVAAGIATMGSTVQKFVLVVSGEIRLMMSE